MPEKLQIINNQLSKEKFNLKDIADRAIEKCANNNYIHDDLHLRHIAVRPIFENNKIRSSFNRF